MFKSKILLLVVVCLTGIVVRLSGADSGRFLYVATPDGAQAEGNSGAGLLVFAMDEGHRFVRRIPVASFAEGVRGLTGSPVSKCLYFGTTQQRMGCFDLETNTVRWEKTYNGGCDRSCVSADGKTIYAPTGWWLASEDTGFLVHSGWSHGAQQPDVSGREIVFPRHADSPDYLQREG